MVGTSEKGVIVEELGTAKEVGTVQLMRFVQLRG